MNVDQNKRGQKNFTINDGPIESALEEQVEDTMLEGGTLLYGTVWTSGPDVVIRYYEARPLGGEVIPICGVARLSGGELKKRPGPAPGSAVLPYPTARFVIVDGFR